jgi:hypothetical protein
MLLPLQLVLKLFSSFLPERIGCGLILLDEALVGDGVGVELARTNPNDSKRFSAAAVGCGSSPSSSCGSSMLDNERQSRSVKLSTCRRTKKISQLNK